MSVTRKLASFVADLSFEDLPVDAVKMAKLVTLDTLGVVFAGARGPSSKIIVDFVREMGGKKESTVIGQGFKTPSPNAALANAVMGHALEFDDLTTNFLDSTQKGGLHAGPQVIGAAMAISELIGANGKDFITAVVPAYDVCTRLELSGPSQITHRQAAAWHPSGVFGTFAATAAAGKLLDFDVDQIVNAFGIAGSQASGIFQCLVEGFPMMKDIHSGLAARNGVLSALLTQRGIEGPKEIFEGKFGFYNAYYGGSYDPEKVTYKIGEIFGIIYDSFKLWPTSGLCHSSIMAALELVQTYDIKPEDVEEVKVWVSKYIYMYVVEPLEGKDLRNPHCHLPFAVAVAIAKRQVTLEYISEAGIRDPELLDLMKKIKTIIDPDLVHNQCVMEIALKDGRKVKKRIDAVKGRPENPASDKELKDKFRSCASGVITEPERIEEIIYTIDNLENLDNIVSLIELCG